MHTISKLKEYTRSLKDKSNDGISILETDEGGCIQLVNNGIYTLMSFDMYEQLINTDMEGLR